MKKGKTNKKCLKYIYLLQGGDKTILLGYCQDKVH